MLSLLEEINPVVKALNLRELAMNLKIPSQAKDIKLHIHETLTDVMKQAGIIALNLDDSEIQYDDLYDPELSVILGGRVINENIWTPENMINKGKEG